MNDAPKCFAVSPMGTPECGSCEFREACRYCRATEPAMESRSGMVSFEEVESWMTEIADFDHIPGCEEDVPPARRSRRNAPGSPPPPELNGLGELLRFMLSLDDYTLGFLAEVIVPDDSRPGAGRSIADLARLHRCSRQAMHRKALAAVRRHPELAGLFQLTLRKIGRGRASFGRSGGELRRV